MQDPYKRLKALVISLNGDWRTAIASPSVVFVRDITTGEHSIHRYRYSIHNDIVTSTYVTRNRLPIEKQFLELAMLGLQK